MRMRHAAEATPQRHRGLTPHLRAARCLCRRINVASGFLPLELLGCTKLREIAFLECKSVEISPVLGELPCLTMCEFTYCCRAIFGVSVYPSADEPDHMPLQANAHATRLSCWAGGCSMLSVQEAVKAGHTRRGFMRAAMPVRVMRARCRSSWAGV